MKSSKVFLIKNKLKKIESVLFYDSRPTLRITGKRARGEGIHI